MKLMFPRIGFHAGSGGKPEVDVVFGGIGFLGPLSFVDRLRELIPFDGFSDPPYVDVSPGRRDGRLRPRPAQRVGRRLQPGEHLPRRRRPGAVPRRRDDGRVPLLLQGRAVPAHRHVHRRRRVGRPAGVARRAWCCWSWASRRAPALSVDLGVASGSVSISVGVYLRLEADKGLLTAYFRIRGEVDVLGLISASITLELSLTYHFETGKLIGRASLVVEVEVLFFSASVEITVERKLAGSKGDPTMYQVMPPDAGRHERRLGPSTASAFAPVPRLRQRGARCPPPSWRPRCRTRSPTTPRSTSPCSSRTSWSGPADGVLSDFPAAADWVGTLAGRRRSGAVARRDRRAAAAARRPDPDARRRRRRGRRAAADDPGRRRSRRRALSDETWRTNPASRMSDHAVDLHLAAITAAPTRRPASRRRPGGRPACCDRTLARSPTRGPLLRRLAEERAGRADGAGS